MNIFKKGIFALLITGLIVSCEEDDSIMAHENTEGTGLTEISFSSFEATPGPDENGIEDGTYVTVKPLAVGVTSYNVDFGDGSTPVTITEPGGTAATASHDYPNELEEVTYTITVTAKSNAGRATLHR